MALKLVLEILKVRNHWEFLDVDCKMTLECILQKCGGRCGLDSSGSGYGPVAGSYEESNEFSGCIKGWEFLD